VRRVAPRLLLVAANPYAAVCALTGRPSAAVPFEGSRDSYVGAMPDVDASARSKRWAFVFHVAEVDVPDTSYYRRRVQEGALLARCERSAMLSPFGRSVGSLLEAWEARRQALGFEAGPVPTVTLPQS
jgi:hypothetical protein